MGAVMCVWVQLTSIVLLFGIYLISLALYSKHLVTTFSSGDTNLHLTFPTSLESLRHCLHVLRAIQLQAPLQVFCLFSAAYIFKQAFSIPGSVFLNLLAGALFPVPAAFPLVCVLSALGASFCFLFSKHVFSHLFNYCFAAKINYFRDQVESNSDNLLFFLLFMRIFPFSPNALINIACPVVGVPLGKFFISVLFGLMPYNYTCVQSGAILASVKSVNDIFSQRTVVKLCSIAVIMLVPVILRRIGVFRKLHIDTSESKTVNSSGGSSPRQVITHKPIEKNE